MAFLLTFLVLVAHISSWTALGSATSPVDIARPKRTASLCLGVETAARSSATLKPALACPVACAGLVLAANRGLGIVAFLPILATRDHALGATPTLDTVVILETVFSGILTTGLGRRIVAAVRAAEFMTIGAAGVSSDARLVPRANGVKSADSVLPPTKPRARWTARLRVRVIALPRPARLHALGTTSTGYALLCYGTGSTRCRAAYLGLGIIAASRSAGLLPSRTAAIGDTIVSPLAVPARTAAGLSGAGVITSRRTTQLVAGWTTFIASDAGCSGVATPTTRAHILLKGLD